MKDWTRSIISSDLPIIELIRLLDNAHTQIALVTGDKGQLLGSVTDGDIRRGILRGLGLNESVSKIMNCTPVTVNQKDSLDIILAKMRHTGVKRIPVLDQSGVPLNVVSIEDFLGLGERDNWAVIMVGGLGTRLRPLTEHIPKPLVPVAGRPALELIIENLRNHNFRKIFLAVNYRADMIEAHFGDGSEFGVEIHYLREPFRMGTAGALSLFPERPEKPFLVMNGDLVTQLSYSQLVNFHQEHNADVTISVREYFNEIPFGVVEIEEHRMIRMMEKPVERYLVNSGIYVLSPEVLGHLPAGKPIDMTDLIEKVVCTGGEVVAFPVHEYWCDIGRHADLQKANEDLERLQLGSDS